MRFCKNKYSKRYHREAFGELVSIARLPRGPFFEYHLFFFFLKENFSLRCFLQKLLNPTSKCFYCCCCNYKHLQLSFFYRNTVIQIIDQWKHCHCSNCSFSNLRYSFETAGFENTSSMCNAFSS